jgi:hypothetical protein
VRHGPRWDLSSTQEISMAIPNAALMADPKFVELMMESIRTDRSLFTVRDLLERPPKFRKAREISARRKRKLEKRGEYCQFVRWTVNGKCRYQWCAPASTAFHFRFGPWQSPKYQPPPVTTYSMETRYVVDGGGKHG